MNQVRRVLAQQSALLQRRHYQRNVSLLEIPHSTVHKLGAAAARPLAEVVRFHEHYIQPASCSIHGDSHASCATPDYRNVPRLLLRSSLADPAQHLVPAHHTPPILIRPNSSTAPPHVASVRGAPFGRQLTCLAIT